MKGIRQLADHLDISIGTVSRALNGKPDVNDETRRRVLEAAEKFGYVANQAGRSLRKGATGIIGFMMQTGHEITGQGDTFFMSVFDGVQTVLARHKLDLVALLCSSEEDPDAYMKRVVARGFADGIILSATRYRDDRFGTLHKAGIPFISLGRGLEEAGLTPGREVAVIGQYSPLVQFLSPRLTCFRPALRELGVAVAESLLSTMPAFAGAYPQAPRQCLWPMHFIEGESG